MPAAAHIAASIIGHPHRAIAREGFKFRLAGLALIALLPALFWTLILSGAAYCFDFTVTHAELAAVAVAISVFLSAVCLPIMMNRG